MRPLLDLIGQCLARGFSIPEIDAFIDEQLASARGGLRQDGSMTDRRLRLLEPTIESAAAVRERSVLNKLLASLISAKGGRQAKR